MAALPFLISPYRDDNLESNARESNPPAARVSTNIRAGREPIGEEAKDQHPGLSTNFA
jgi:hypothetical protein